MSAFQYIADHWDTLEPEVVTQLELPLLAVAIAAVVGIAMGVLGARDERFDAVFTAINSTLLTVPSFALFGTAFIDIMSANTEVRRIARDYLPFVVFAPLLGVFAFAYDGVYIGATWARDMRNLMVLSLLIFFTAWLLLRSFGNAGLWGALLVHYAARGGLEALRYPALLKRSFKA